MRSDLRSGPPSDRALRRAPLRGTGVLLVFIALVAGLLGARHLARTSGEPVADRPPSTSPGSDGIASPDVAPRLMAIQREALDLARKAGLAAGRIGSSQVVRPSPTQAALVLLPRPQPYGVDDLLTFPDAVTRSRTGSLTLHLPVVVLRDASLVVDSQQARQLRLLSSPGGFASIVGLGGTIQLRGSERLPLDVTTLDPGTGSADERLDDGRGFVLNSQGRMDLTHVRVSAVGFGQGMASGVAWAGTAYDPARGSVTRSSFRRNRYGAYTFHTVDMTWTNNVFADNQVYGLVQADFSSHSVVRDNEARHNGRHGFVIARGCNDNLLEGNRATANLGDGFALNDAPVDSHSAAAAAARSTGNVLRGNTATANGGSGADVHGGRDTLLVDNRLIGNQLGIRYGATASGTVEGNQLLDNTLYGVRIEASAGEVAVRRNYGSGSWSDLAVARPVEQSGNQFGVERTTYAARDPGGLRGLLARVGDDIGSRPALAVWLAILGVPALARSLTRL